jgi:hypothetical protein
LAHHFFAVSKRVSRRLTIRGGHSPISGGYSPVSSIDISLGKSHWPKFKILIQTAVCAQSTWGPEAGFMCEPGRPSSNVNFS